MKTIAPLYLCLLPATALAGVLLPLDAKAGQVFWELNSFSPNLQSNSQPLTAATRFQLGVFTGGFVPTVSNLPDWSANWRSWEELQYDPGTGAFSREILFDENPAPFAEGARLYCWAYAATSTTGSEYFLATDASWLVPGTDPLAFPVFVDPETAGQVIFGAAFPDSGTIQTAAVSSVTAPAYLFADWQRARFSLEQRKNPAVSGTQADPDGDGRGNLMEYLSGSDPLAADPPLVPEISIPSGPPAGEILAISFSAPPSARAHWEFQISSDLAHWAAAASPPAYSPVTELWSLSPAVSPASGRQFWRLRVDAPVAP